jgi:hypothetical protein
MTCSCGSPGGSTPNTSQRLALVLARLAPCIMVSVKGKVTVEKPTLRKALLMQCIPTLVTEYERRLSDAFHSIVADGTVVFWTGNAFLPGGGLGRSGWGGGG